MLSVNKEDRACYGTPLKDLEEDDVRSEKAPRIEDQIVTDKKGRRRFHGAFTGGFSAGYFNSVGTKDGWAPSAFTSSKSKKASDGSSSLLQTPQDFMDEEDLEAHGIAPQQIQTTSSYDDTRDERKRKRAPDTTGPIPGQPVLEILLQPTSETMGMKLLKKLGWRLGQGVGPRLSKKEKKSLQQKKATIYGCLAPEASSLAIKDEDTSGESDSSDSPSRITYAPDDLDPSLLSSPKSDLFGLGYEPLERRDVFGTSSLAHHTNSLTMTHKNRKISIRGQAFGVGAFEEEDENIYGKEDMSHYDFELCPPPTKQKDRPDKKSDSALALLGVTEKLKGFELSSNPLEKPKIYPLPSIPSTFSAHHVSRKKRFEMKPSEVKGLGRHDLSHEDRRRIIADASSHDIEVRSGVKESCESELSVHLSLDSDLLELMKENDESPSNISDFKPFSKDLDKQRRYDLFMKMKEKGMKDRFHLVQPKTLTEWEKERERMEFQRAAELFAPLTSSMALRFTIAKTEDSIVFKDRNIKEEGDVLGGVELDDRTKAAKSKMFGALTQFQVEWAPDDLLCKRFNVPNPHGRSKWTSVHQSSSKNRSIFEFLNEQSNKKEACAQNQPNEDITVENKSPRESESKNALEIEEQFGLKVSVSCPPSKDLFKAIFQDSDSDKEEEDPHSNTERNDNHPERSQDGLSRIPSGETHTKSRWDPPNLSTRSSNFSCESSVQASGIFSNLDFEALNQYRHKSYRKESPSPSNPKRDYSTSPTSEKSAARSEYGPSFPHEPQSSGDKCAIALNKGSTSSIEEVWVEKIPSRVSKKHKHKSKKSKKKKHKKEKKHKLKKHSKHRRSKDSSSSSSSSESR